MSGKVRDAGARTAELALDQIRSFTVREIFRTRISFDGCQGMGASALAVPLFILVHHADRGALFMPSLWDYLMLGWLALEILVTIVTRTRRGGGKVQDRGSMLLIWIVIACSMSVSAWAQIALPAATVHNVNWLKTLAVGVLVGGLTIRLAAILSLGRSFSANVAIRTEQKIQRTGLYRIVRHPSYLGLLLIFGAVGLHSHNLASFAIMLVPTTLALLYRIRVEEAVLLEAFGDDYAAYSQETKRLIPGIH
jgi:protein-S-isoprenylcysteine O-methyltransferase Ste14